MQDGKQVGLFATCLVDLFRPSVGFAAVHLLEQAGYTVHVPAGQTCCGQPAFNSGDRRDARDLAQRVIAEFEEFDYVVIPSGSCASTVSKHYGELFQGDDKWRARADALSQKTYELVQFLTDVAGVTSVDASHEGRVTYHDSCSGLRELGIRDQPRQLLGTVRGLELTEMNNSEVCCGFGGTFAVKYGEISDQIVGEKSSNIEASGAGLVLAGDLGCLMNMAGKLKRQRSNVQCRHVAEILAGMTDSPAIAESENG